MNEAQRQYYLERMGVRLWYARSPLPGAAASPEYDMGAAFLSEPENEPVVTEKEPPPAQAPDAPRASAKSLRSLTALMDERAKPAEADVDRKGAAPTTQAPASEKIIRPEPTSEPLAVDVGVAFGGNFNVVAQFDAKATPELQQRLLENILKAFGQSQGRLLRLQWPVFANPGVPGNDDQGLGRLMLEQVMPGAQSRSWILLGSGPERLFSRLPLTDEHRILLAFEASLAQLASDSQQKKALWQAFQSSVAPQLAQ
ncbi:hypothetical protein QQM79_17185 [Marinobacteraceae bacterium S3BR75-40.1]